MRTKQGRNKLPNLTADGKQRETHVPDHILPVVGPHIPERLQAIEHSAAGHPLRKQKQMQQEVQDGRQRLYNQFCQIFHKE